MLDLETLTTPSVESPGADTPPQETTLAPQGDTPPQKTEQPRVEGQADKPQVTEPPRAKPSDFYRERERVRRLEDAYKSQSQQMQEMAALLKKLQPPEATETNGKFDWEEFLKNPENVLTARENRFLDHIQKLETRFSNWEKSTTQESQARSSREALEILFPKAGEEDKSELEDRVESNPRKERIDQMLKIPFISRMWDESPQEAAEFILFKLSSEKPASPTVIKKTVMGGTARGGPGMGKSTQSPIEEKRAELKRLSDEADKNEDLRFDEKHKARRDQLIREIERLSKE